MGGLFSTESEMVSGTGVRNDTKNNVTVLVLPSDKYAKADLMKDVDIMADDAKHFSIFRFFKSIKDAWKLFKDWRASGVATKIKESAEELRKIVTANGTIVKSGETFHPIGPLDEELKGYLTGRGMTELLGGNNVSLIVLKHHLREETDEVVQLETSTDSFWSVHDDRVKCLNKGSGDGKDEYRFKNVDGFVES